MIKNWIVLDSKHSTIELDSFSFISSSFPENVNQPKEEARQIIQGILRVVHEFHFHGFLYHTENFLIRYGCYFPTLLFLLFPNPPIPKFLQKISLTFQWNETNNRKMITKKMGKDIKVIKNNTSLCWKNVVFYVFVS